jgi:hypothetical protein
MSIEHIDIAGAATAAPLKALPMRGASPDGGRICANSYFLEQDGSPWFAVSGEAHYSRLDPRDWLDELIKMRMCGIEIVSTYVFWNHHEERRGVFDWSGRRDLRAFVRACAEAGLYAIVRLGPWCHGEARNGGFPDWLYDAGLALRSNDPRYLALVARLYREIGAQLQGLLYKDGGPVIGVQLENEHMHAGAPWETSLGQGEEWIETGSDGEAHILELQRLAVEAGIDVPLYTCTAWGGASAPLPEVLPLWGGYSFQPWLFNGDAKVHPATPEYLFRNNHSNAIPATYNFAPRYDPESAPYACCEMGGGMACFYNYRFELPPAAVEAMAVVKAASGCNLLGYYMFHGGTNPRTRTGCFLNEHSLPKLSYDYQAAIGECGQVRAQAKSLSLLHHLFHDFEDRFCGTTTVIPAGAEAIDPRDPLPLRWAVRASGRSGFLFICNYQDHARMMRQEGFSFELALPGERLSIPSSGSLSLERDAACVLPFHFDLGGIDLAYASAQPITTVDAEGETVFFFFAPSGMEAEYRFEDPRVEKIEVSGGEVVMSALPSPGRARQYTAYARGEGASWIRVLGIDGSRRSICSLTRAQAMLFWKAELGGREYVLLSAAPALVEPASAKVSAFRLECSGPGPFELISFPPLPSPSVAGPATLRFLGDACGLASYAIDLPEEELGFEIERRGERSAVLRFGQSAPPACKRALLNVAYEGDVGSAYIGDELVADNFCNGQEWNLDLLRLNADPFVSGLRLAVRPLRVGSKIISDTSMAGRSESAVREVGAIMGIRVVLVREVAIFLGGSGPANHLSCGA